MGNAAKEVLEKEKTRLVKEIYELKEKMYTNFISAIYEIQAESLKLIKTYGITSKKVLDFRKKNREKKQILYEQELWQITNRLQSIDDLVKLEKDLRSISNELSLIAIRENKE